MLGEKIPPLTEILSGAGSIWTTTCLAVKTNQAEKVRRKKMRRRTIHTSHLNGDGDLRRDWSMRKGTGSISIFLTS
jgi:hypothetical protein